MHSETLRQQGAEACRTYFAELGEDLTELCAADRGDVVSKALLVRAISAAAEAVGIHDVPNQTTFAEGFVGQAIAEIEARRGALPITLP